MADPSLLYTVSATLIRVGFCLDIDLHTDCESYALVPDRLGHRKCLWNPDFECLNSIRNISDCIFYVLACVLGTLAGIEPS